LNPVDQYYYIIAGYNWNTPIRGFCLGIYITKNTKKDVKYATRENCLEQVHDQVILQITYELSP